MAAIVTQNDIVKIINASTDNLEVIINTLATAIDKITKNNNTKILKNSSAKMQNICGVVNSYITILNSAIDNIPEFTTPTDKMVISSMALSDAMDVVILFAESLNNDKLKTIDKSTFNRVEIVVKIFQSLAQIFDSMEKYYNSAFGKGDTITIFGKNTEAMVKSIIEVAKCIQEINDIDISTNITKTINSVNEFIDALSKLQNLNSNTINAKDIEKNINSVETITKKLNESKSLNIVNSKSILKCIKDVNNIIEALNDSQKIDESSLKELSANTKAINVIIDSWKDIFVSVSDMIGVSLKIVLFNKIIGLAINIVIKFIESLEKFKEVNIPKEATDNIKNIKNIIDDVYNIFKSISKMIGLSITVGLFGWIVILAVFIVINLIKSVIKLINSINITSDAANSINNLDKIFDSLHNVMSNIVKMIGLSVLVGLFGWVIIISILIVAILAKVIVKLISFINVSNEDFEKVNSLKIIFKSLYDIMKTLIKMIPAAILSLVGMVMAIVFVSLLIVVVLIINTLLKITSKIDDKTVKQIIGLGRVFKAMLSMCGAIIFLALVVPIAAFALVMIIIPFLIMALLVYAIIAVSSWLLHKLSDFSRKQFLLLAWNTLTIAGIFIIMCLGILFAAIAGRELQKDGALETIGKGLLGILGMLVVCFAIGWFLNLKKVKVSFLSFRKTFPALVEMIAMIGLLMLAILGLGLIGEYIHNNIISILEGLGGVLTIVAVIVVICVGIQALINKNLMIQTKEAIIPLLAILGLLVVTGLAIIAFGFVGLFIEALLLPILKGLGAISVVVILVGAISALLNKFKDKILKGTKSVTPLLIILGLLVAAGLAIIFFGKVGEHLTPENLGNIFWGLIGVSIVAALIVGLATVLIPGKKIFEKGALSVIPLLIILGLLVAAGLSIMLFGKVGEYLKENLGVVAGGFLAIVVVVAIILGLTFILVKILPLTGMAISAIIPVLVILGLLLLVCIAIVEFGEIGKKIHENSELFINSFEALTNVMWALADYGWEMAKLIIPITLAAAVSLPTLFAVNMMLFGILNMVAALDKICQITIDEKTIIDKLNSLKSVLSTLATSIKDLLTGAETGDSPVFEIPDPEFFAILPWKKRKVTAIDKLDNVTKIITTLKNISEALVKIEKFKIDATKGNKLIVSVQSIFAIIKELSTQITTNLENDNTFNDELIKGSSWWDSMWGDGTDENKTPVLDKLDNVSKVTMVLSSITEALNDIQELNINEAQINKKIESIFAYIDKIGTQIEANLNKGDKSLLKMLEDKTKEETNFWGNTETTVIENTIAKSMTRIGDIFGSLGDVIGALKALSELEITEDTKKIIDTNIDALFEYVNSISLKVNDLLNPTQQINYVETLAVQEARFATQENVADIIKNQSEEYVEKLDNVSKIFIAVSSILENLNKIKDLKFDESSKDKINNMITLVFSSISEVLNLVSTNIDNLSSETVDTTGLENFTNGLSNLCDVMNELCEIKINNFSKTKTVLISFLKEMTLINYDKFKNSDKICTVINSMSTLLTSGPTSFKLMEQRLGHLERLSKVIIALGEVTPAGVKRSKELLNDQIKYLNKVNSVDINKLKITANMLSSMAALSSSIQGNFQGLAKTLNEEIAPLLEKLKELMESINENVTTHVGGSGGSGGGSNSGYYVNKANSGLTVSGTNGEDDMEDYEGWKDAAKNKLDSKDPVADYERYLNNRKWDVSEILNEIYQLMLGCDDNVLGGKGVVVRR